MKYRVANNKIMWYILVKPSVVRGKKINHNTLLFIGLLIITFLEAVMVIIVW